MSYAEIKKTINSDLHIPLNTQLQVSTEKTLDKLEQFQKAVKEAEASHLLDGQMPKKFISETGEGVLLYDLEEPASIVWNTRLILAKFIAPVSGSYGIELNYSPAMYLPALYAVKPTFSAVEDLTTYSCDAASQIINATPLNGYIYSQQFQHTAESGNTRGYFSAYNIHSIPVSSGGTARKQYFYASKGEVVAITAGGATNVGTNNVIVGKTVTLNKLTITYQQQ